MKRASREVSTWIVELSPFEVDGFSEVKDPAYVGVIASFVYFDLAFSRADHSNLNSLSSVEVFPTTDCALVIANFEQGENFAMTKSIARSLIEASSAEPLNSCWFNIFDRRARLQ